MHVLRSTRRASTRQAPAHRRLTAWLVCLAGLPALTMVLTSVRSHVAVGSALMLDLCVVMLVAALGGARVGVVASLLASGLTNWFLTPPLHRLAISDAENVVGLTVFLFVTVVISVLVARTARQAERAASARADAVTLAHAAATLIAADDPIPPLLDQIRSTFDLDDAALAFRRAAGWTVVAHSGAAPGSHPDTVVDLQSDELRLELRGGVLSAEDIAVLRGLGAHLATAAETRQLRREAERATALAEADALRTTILRAVSHDFRTPLATIMAASTGLLRGEGDFTDGDRRVLLDDIASAAHRLDRMVRDLLDISRLQAGAVRLDLRPTPLEDVVATALTGVVAAADRVVVDVDERLPLAMVDAVLLERAFANIVSNAVAWSPATATVSVTGAADGPRVLLSVVDHGPGIAAVDRDRVHVPFERTGDRSNDAGAGLGLAIARGFVEIIGGVLRFDETPGGGLTVVFDLPAAPPEEP